MSDFDFAKGATIVVNLVDGSTLFGEFVSVNTKGINIKVDGKVISRGLNRVTDAHLAVMGTVNAPADMFDNDATYTTAELAAVFGMAAKDLRKVTRSLGMGVGKGHKYGLSATDARTISAAVNDNA
jgi:hypothetical protein